MNKSKTPKRDKFLKTRNTKDFKDFLDSDEEDYL